jgi:threonylcarbamoyladenosine tRNA methylthiotransferase MtaB
MSAAPASARQRVSLDTVGCKLNLYETEALASGFQERGYDVVAADAEADICIINTCTVTGSGDADSRKAVRRARRAHPQATVVATGCYAQRSADGVYSAGADLVVDNTDKSKLIERLEAYLAGAGSPRVADGPRTRTSSFLDIRGPVPGGRTRGSLQIQDGCSEHCTYCIIPSVRGPGVSRSSEEVLAQARRMVDAGYRELALTGVHTGSYGHDHGEPTALVRLLTELDRVPGLERIRLNSVEPGFVTDELIEFAAASDKLCRHFHIPLQSGDDQILRRMGRRYSRDRYGETVARIAAAIPNCAIGADVMVGFPGEEDKHFLQTFELLERAPVTYLHVFPYSLREGTPAARLRDHKTRACKRERSRLLIELGAAKRRVFHQRHVGASLPVLVEDRGDIADGMATGLSDNYIKAFFPANGRTNCITWVRVDTADAEAVRGHVED